MGYRVRRPFRGNAKGGAGGVGTLDTYTKVKQLLLQTWIPIGTRAPLWSPHGLIGWWRKISATKVKLVSHCQLYNSDGGKEFTYGADGSGSDIERLNGSGLTWSVTPGLGTGGPIFNGSGAHVFPCFGEYGAKGAITVTVRGYPTVVTAADTQVLVAGLAVRNRDAGIRGGARRVAGIWKGCWEILNPQLPVRGGGTSNSFTRTVATGTELLLSSHQLVSESITNNAAYVAGAYSGDGDAADEQNAAEVSSGPATNFDNGIVCLNIEAATETDDQLLYRVEEVAIHNLEREAGAA